MEIARSLQNVPSSYIREILSAASDPSVISLAGGLPDPDTFPIELMRSTFEGLCDKPEVFQYGTTAGYTPLLDFLSDYYQLPSNHSAVVCTGSQQGLDLVARAYINPGDTVVMEAPSYLGAMQVFGLVGANIVTVSQVASGPNLEQLETCFKINSPKMFYAVPDFHNPTGVCWTLENASKKSRSFAFNTMWHLLKMLRTANSDLPERRCQWSRPFVQTTPLYFVRSLKLLLQAFALVWSLARRAILSRLLRSNKVPICTPAFQCKLRYWAC